MNLWVILFTGLTVGGLTCLAVQGGLLASIIATNENKNTLRPTLIFLMAKLAAHAALGFGLGAFGSVVGISDNVTLTVQILVGVYMILVALNLLDIHPIFRYVQIQPPKFLAKKIRTASTPALLGLMTVFMPCGTTLAMEALAVGSGNPVTGALIMAVFVLGTTPAFLGIGYASSKLGDKYRKNFFRLAAILVMYLGLSSINGALIVKGINILPQRESGESETTQNVTINVMAYGYEPRYVKVKQGEEVTVTLVGKGGYSCASAFRIPSLSIGKNLLPDEKYTFSFTPTKKGKIPFTCSMGMYTGVIEVI